MSGKLLVLITVLCLVISLAYAENYDASIQVYPTGIVSSTEEIIIFGDIDSLDSTTGVYSTDIRLEVENENTNSLINTYAPDYISTFERTSYLEDGFFFKKMTIGAGDYLLRLRIEGITEAIRSFDVNSYSRLAKLRLLDYTVYQDMITVKFSLENLDSSSHSYTVSFVDAKLNSPTTYSVSVNAYSTSTFEREFDLDEFEMGNFILVAQAKESSGSETLSSNADYIIVYNSDKYSSGRNLVITNLTAPSQLYTGDIAYMTTWVKNYGDKEASYRFEYVINNQLFRNGDVSYVQPGHTNAEKFFLEVPEGSLLYITVRAVTEDNAIERSSSYLVSTRTKQYTYALSDYSDNVFAGSSLTFNATIANTGNQNDSYRIKIIDWQDYNLDKESFLLQPNRFGSFKITLNTSKDMQIGEYPVLVNICNSADLCANKTFIMHIIKAEKDQNIVLFDLSQVNKTFTENGSVSYNITVKNIGVAEKNYAVGFEPELSPKIIFSVVPYDTKTVTFTLTPKNNTDQTVRVYLSAENTTIFTQDLNLAYREGGLLTGMFINIGKGYTPGLIILAVIGAAVLVYLVYGYFSNKAWLNKVDSFNYQSSRIPPPGYY